MVLISKLGGKRKYSNKSMIDLERMLADEIPIRKRTETDNNFNLLKEDIDSDLDRNNKRNRSLGNKKQNSMKNFFTENNDSNERNIYQMNFDDYVTSNTEHMTRDQFVKSKTESNKIIPRIKQYQINKPQIPIQKLHRNKSMNVDHYNEQIYVNRDSKQSKRTFNSAGPHTKLNKT
jgi:hypothetical protein